MSPDSDKTASDKLGAIQLQVLSILGVSSFGLIVRSTGKQILNILILRAESWNLFQILDLK